jgi:hypothetical protein
MRFPLVSCAVILCALPASGDNSLLNTRTITALTSIDAVPSTSGLNDAFNSPDAALVDLEVLARDPSVEVGIAIRATRALPGYCPPAPQSCGTGTGVHETLIQIISDYQALPSPGGQDLLRLRAAVEALGATHAVLDADVELMLPLLHHPSRDVRATVVRALRGCCNDRAKAALKALKVNEPTQQVQFALLSALQDFEQCPGP